MKISSIKYLLPTLLLLNLTAFMGSITPLDDQSNSNITGGSAPHDNMTFLDKTIPESRLKTRNNLNRLWENHRPERKVVTLMESEKVRSEESEVRRGERAEDPVLPIGYGVASGGKEWNYDQ